MPSGDPSRPDHSLSLSDAPPSASGEIDPTQDLAAALHEVSNALTVLLGWVDAARTSTDPKVVASALDLVASRASHARDLARRAIGGAMPPSQAALVSALLDDAVLGLAVEAKRASVTFAVRADVSVASASLPSSPALLQILTNLLLNAIAFSPPGASVHVTVAASPGDRALFHIQDEGPGIPPEARDRLFEAGVSSRRGGAGIGLRHSAALAARAGGQLRLAASERGARFELLWPIASEDSITAVPAPKSAERPVADRPSIKGARILVVEDDDAVIELLELALEARGATIVSVKARADLPEALKTGTFDAALLDMSPILGDVDGAVAELRRASPDARLVVMSGSVAHADVGGGAVWVRKPFEVREIVDALGTPRRRT